MRYERRVDEILRGLRRNGCASARVVAMVALLSARAAVAQYELTPSGISGGGGTVTGGPFVLTGTIGRFDAGYVSEGRFSVYGGLWPPIAFALVATPTPTASPTHTTTRSPTAPPSPSPSAPLPPSPSPTGPAPPSFTVSPSRSRTPSPTPTRTPGTCAGDCGRDGDVTVDDLVQMTSIALGLAPLDQCLPGDANDDRQITIDDLLVAVNHALNGCPIGRAVVSEVAARDAGEVP